MQPEKAQKIAHEKAAASTVERAERSKNKEARIIGEQIKSRTDKLFSSSPLTKEGGKRLIETYRQDNVFIPSKRHGFLSHLRILGSRGTIERTKTPVDLGISGFEDFESIMENPPLQGGTTHEKLHRAGYMQKESWVGEYINRGPNRVRFGVIERDTDGNVVSTNEIAVLEDGVISVSEIRKRDEEVIYGSENPALTLVHEVLDKFEVQAAHTVDAND